MTEIFENISQEVRDLADATWRIAAAQDNPLKAAEFLNNTTEYLRNLYSEEEMAFLQFYFDLQMEMIKNETDDNSER